MPILHIQGYRLIKKIGQGGMANIYLAVQQGLEREVALKVMSPHLSSDPEFGERFLREAKIVSSLNHPNIVTVFEVGLSNNHHFLSMEYIEGQDLKELCGKLTLNEILKVIRDVATALLYSGSKGYVHRDIKPENIMIREEDNRTVVMDFGIAKSANRLNNLTQTGVAVGTPYYMSPEQAKGLEIDVRSDIYSLGVVFYQLLTGKLPFDGDSAVTVAMKHATAPPPSLPDYMQSTFNPIFEKLLAKDRDQRFQSGQEIIDKLDAISRSEIEQIARQKTDTPSQEVQHSNSDDTIIVKTRSSGILRFGGKWPVIFKRGFLAAGVVAIAVGLFFFLGSKTLMNESSNTLKETFNTAKNVFQESPEVEQSTTVVAEAGDQIKPLNKSLIDRINQDLVLIPAGTFKMGIRKSGMSDARPLRDVAIQSFYLSKYELTQAQYNAYLVSQKTGQDKFIDSQMPVTEVNWYETQKFIAWLNAASSETYRLPSEAEWEYVAKANTTTLYPWGNGIGEGRANCQDCNAEQGISGLLKVGQFPANPFGIYDMQGNVWEWTQDCYKTNYRGLPNTGTAVALQNCQRYVLRGGAYNSVSREVITSYRSAAMPNHQSKTIGFRLAKDN